MPAPRRALAPVTSIVLAAAAQTQCLVIIASTSEVYGKSAKLPFQEDEGDRRRKVLGFVVAVLVHALLMFEPASTMFPDSLYAAAVLAVNGIPIVAEVDESLTLDPADVEAKITPYTKAIIVVHMRGAPSQMDELLAIAKRRGLKLIEDTAQANGGSSSPAST